MAARNGYRNLVLGAWGTGAFGHDTKRVAGYFYKLFFEEGFNEFFDNIVFAILKDEYKIEIFKDVFGENITEGLPYEDTKDKPGFCCFYELEYRMPLCNHTQSLSGKNLGYRQGMTVDNIPFEAELTDDGNRVHLCVIMPAIYGEDKPDKKEEKVIGISYEVEDIDFSILDIGMVDEGQEKDLSVIKEYVNFLIDREIVIFSTCEENGSVFYRIDELGNELAKVLITLSEEDKILAKTNLTFIPFAGDNRPFYIK